VGRRKGEEGQEGCLGVGGIIAIFAASGRMVAVNLINDLWYENDDEKHEKILAGVLACFVRFRFVQFCSGGFR
jgi:hypothetical protein